MNWIFETERLKLREFDSSDGEEMYKLNLDPEVARWTGDPPFESVEVATQFLKDYSDYKKNGYGRWTCVLKSTEEVIGWCGLKMEEDGMVDVGYRFHKRFWGNGYGTESALASLEYGFITLGIDLIVGRASVSNPASIRIFEKIGMDYWKDEIDRDLGPIVVYKIEASRENKKK